jgi:RNA polymerase sigma-54 factor
MDINFRLNQSGNLSQQLNLAPQLLNWLRLLQCPTADLTAMVARELESNPTLEADSPAATLSTDGIRSTAEAQSSTGDSDLDAKLEFLSQVEADWRYDRNHASNLNGASREDQIERHQYVMDSLTANLTLQDHLLQQVAALGLDAEQTLLAEFLVGSIDNRGYLVSPIAELAGESGTPRAQLEAMLTKIQQFDPAGIGARDLAECILLQMDRRHEEDFIPARIVRDHMDLLAEHDYAGLANRLDTSEAEVLDAAAYIRTLDPSPGSAFSSTPIEFITPDITIRDDEGELVIELHDEQLPRLRISAYCKQLLAHKQLGADDRAYMRDKMRNANFLIQGIGQRQETLRKVAEEIVRIQAQFLSAPDGQLKPLTMAKVAGVIGVHETTVSRALANKYIQTPRGLFEMKHFFRSGYLCSDGTSLTPDAVKDQIKQLIDTEKATEPLTDLDIVERLQEQGLELARRTIAKYRDEIGVPASKERKKMATLKARTIRISEPLRFKQATTRNRLHSTARTPVLARSA